MTRKITFLLALALAGCGVEAAQVDDKQSNLIWIPISCYASCTSDSQCPANERCWNGECRIRPEQTFCVDGLTSGNQGGDRVACNAYGCDSSTGQCRRACTTSTECAPGYLCDTGVGRCVFQTPPFAQGAADTPLPAATPTRERTSICAQKRCTTDAQCGNTTNYMCRNGYCMPWAPHCIDNNTAIWWSHVPYGCDTSWCNPVRHDCAWDCRSTNECSVYNVCDTSTGSCVTP